MSIKNKILVTGGTGFIGSHLTEVLLSQGRDVRVLVMREPLEKIENDNLRIIKNKGAEIVYGDLRDKESLDKAVKDIDTIFHLAGISRPMKIPKHVYYDVNVQGTKNLLEACLNAKIKIKRFIHVSTVSVLGVSPDGTPLKEDNFQEPTGDYGLSKLKGEQIVLEYYKKYNIPVVVIRPPLTYGPRCLVRLIMFKFVQKRLFPLFRKGKAHMEFCYVDNVIQALLLAESTPGILGEVFNISDARSYSISEVVNTIAKVEGVKPPLINNMPVWLGKLMGLGAEVLSRIIGIYPPFSRTAAEWMSKDQNVYNISKAKKVLGYSPEINLEEGIKRTVEWYKEKGLLK